MFSLVLQKCGEVKGMMKMCQFSASSQSDVDILKSVLVESESRELQVRQLPAFNLSNLWMVTESQVIRCSVKHVRTSGALQKCGRM